jgi:hypothetical protein
LRVRICVSSNKQAEQQNDAQSFHRFPHLRVIGFFM